MDVWKKFTWKNLRLNRKRTIVTIIGILLSTAMFTAVASMFFSARTSLIRYETEQKGNYHYSFSHMPLGEAEKLKEHRKIETVFYTTEVGYSKLENCSNEYKPYLYVMACDETAMANLGIRLTKGRLPQNDGELLISRHLYTNGNVKYQVGDTVRLEVGRRMEDGTEQDQNASYILENPEEIIDTSTREYTIVGEMERLSVGVEPYSAPGYTCITCLPEQSQLDYVDVYIRYNRDGLKEEDVLTARILGIEEEAFCLLQDDAAFSQLSLEQQNEVFLKVQEGKYIYNYNSYLVALETGLFKDSSLRALAWAAAVVVVIIILASVFCIRNSFDISITEKIRQYGMLSSIGATKRQIRKNVYYEAFLLGVCAIPLGLLAGNAAAVILVQMSNRLLQGTWKVTLYFELSWPAQLCAVVLGAVTIFFSARKSAAKAARISPIQAIRNSDDLKISSANIRTPRWVNKLFGIGGEISYKNLKRSRKKYRTTVTSIVLCVAVFIVLYSFIHLAFDVIENEYELTGYNLRLEYGTEGTDGYADKINDLEYMDEMTALVRTSLTMDEKPYTEEYEKYLEEAFEEEADKMDARIQLLILSEEDFRDYMEELHLNYSKMKGKAVLLNQVDVFYYPDDGAEYVETRLEQYDWKAGDLVKAQMHLTNEEDEVEERAFQTEIGAVTENRPMGVENTSDRAVLLVGEEYLALLEGTEYRQSFYLNSSDPYETEKSIRAILEDCETTWTIDNISENVKVLESFYTLLAIFLYGFIIVIALIGVTSIFNTITTNMSLRRPEFAMLKSVGMTEKEFRRMIALETCFYGIRSLLIGIPIGTVLSYAVYRVMMSGELLLPYQIPFGGMLISSAAVALLLTLIMQYSIRKTDGENIIETIRSIS